MDIGEKMNSIFRDTCEIEAARDIRDDWQPGNPPEWDSLANMELIAALETEFKITLEFDELMEITNWGEFKKVIAGKISA
jgi:acyl carrier protein